MRQYFTFDDPPINSPPQRNPTENPPEEIYKLLELFTESPCNREIELSNNVFPDNSQNLITNHIEDLKEITTLPELTKPLQLKQKKKKTKIKITISALILYPTVRSTMGNKVLLTRWKKNHLLTSYSTQLCVQPRKKKCCSLEGRK